MSTHLTLGELLGSLHPHLEEAEHVLEEVASELDPPFDAQLREAFAGGKRLRPALVILAGQVFAPTTSPFYWLAAAVETLHTATLIHDDIVDDSHLRRGRRTMHTAWPVGATVLAGDYLLARAAGLVAEIGDPQMLRILTDALRTMCIGEIRQMLAAQQSGPARASRREAYLKAIEAKTATLLAAATEMAATLANAPRCQALALHEFGRELGIAFQITDDVLDYTGDESTLGKPAGADLQHGIATLPAIIYLERTPRGGGVVQAVLAGDRDPELVERALQAILASGAIQASWAEAHAHARASVQALDCFPPGAAIEMLRALPALAVERSR